MDIIRRYKVVSELDGGGPHRRGNLVRLEDSSDQKPRPGTEVSWQTNAASRGRLRPWCLTGTARGPARSPGASDSATTSSGGVGAGGQRGVQRAQPPPGLRPARLLSSPRPLRDEIPGTLLVTIVTLRPSLSGLATEEGAANKKLWAVWGDPPYGVGGGQEVRGRGGAWATEARCLQTVFVPPPRYAGTFPVSTQELVHGPLPPRRGVANVNRALPRVACRIFFFLRVSHVAGSRMVYWRKKKKTLGSLQTA